MTIFILLLGFLLRLISLNQSFWLDEATTANVAAMKVGEILTVFSPGDFHPPLYYLMTHFWAQFFGSGEVALRSLSVIAGVATIYTVYLLGKETVDKKAGIIAALLLATSGLHIFYSQEARMYSLATFFVSLTILFFAKTLKKGRVGEWLLFPVFLTLSILTDYLPVLIVPALWIFAWTKKLNRSWWQKFLASHIILMTTSLLWLPTFIKQINAGLSVKSQSPFWWQILGQTNFKQLVLVPTKFIFGRIDMEPNVGQIVVVGAAFLLFGFLLVRSIKSIRSIRIIWYWLTGPLILGMLISFWVPTLSYFRFLFVLPAFYLLVAAGLTNTPKKTSAILLGVVIVFNLVTSSLYLFNDKNYREDWRALTGFIKEKSIGKNSVVVFVADSQQEAYRYYDKDAKILTSGSVDKNFDEIWLMRYVQEIFDLQEVTRSKIETLGYKKVNEYRFNGVVVWKYVR